MPKQDMPPEYPYPGLRSFRRDEAHLFFGRDLSIGRLLERLSNKRFVSVIGPSGSGKSSLIQAGLVPMLGKDLEPHDSTHLFALHRPWHVIDFRPGARPVENFALALSQRLPTDHRTQFSTFRTAVENKEHR
jgi:ABC-type branched-subunit amino acid transport system ATPase component